MNQHIYQGIWCNNEGAEGYFAYRCENGLYDTWSEYRQGGGASALKFVNNMCTNPETMVLGRCPFNGMQLTPVNSGRHILKAHIAFKGYAKLAEMYRHFFISAQVGDRTFYSTLHGRWSDDPSSVWVNDSELIGDTLKGSSEVRITGPKGLVALIADMGIAPNCTKNGTVVDAVYSMPGIKITSFNPATGAVRVKVTPGAGNTIVSEIATGYLHVYGTSDLTKQMTIIDNVGYDLTPYLKDSTKGEAVLNVTLGTHTFLKVKVEK